MGKKYIIELLDDCPSEFKGIIVFGLMSDGQILAEPIPVEDFTPHTEPDIEQVRKEAYEEGKKQAKVQAELDVCHDIEKVAKGNYKAGLSDAWEAARKVVALSTVDRRKVFGSEYMYSILEKHTASEAIEKLKAYEQEEQIQVGDEVIRHYKSEFAEGDGAPSIFLSEEDGYFRCLAFNGRSIMIAEYPKNQYRKTGRHFPEIAEVLAKMKETDNG